MEPKMTKHEAICIEVSSKGCGKPPVVNTHLQEITIAELTIIHTPTHAICSRRLMKLNTKLSDIMTGCGKSDDTSEFFSCDLQL
jgi:hypothetical protein